MLLMMLLLLLLLWEMAQCPTGKGGWGGETQLPLGGLEAKEAGLREGGVAYPFSLPPV